MGEDVLPSTLCCPRGYVLLITARLMVQILREQVYKDSPEKYDWLI